MCPLWAIYRDHFLIIRMLVVCRHAHLPHVGVLLATRRSHVCAFATLQGLRAFSLSYLGRAGIGSFQLLLCPLSVCLRLSNVLPGRFARRGRVGCRPLSPSSPWRSLRLL